MRKFFNGTKIKKYLLELSNIELTFISVGDVVHKNCFKKIKDLKSIIYAKILFNWMKENIPDDIIPMVGKFFPTKIGEIKQSGRELKIDKFYYKPSDNKIHCCVLDADIERNLKIHTDLYEERTKEYTEKMIESIRKKLGRFYGYFYERCDELGYDWFITDKNLDKNGNYVKLVESKNGDIIINKLNINREDMIII